MRCHWRGCIAFVLIATVLCLICGGGCTRAAGPGGYIIRAGEGEIAVRSGQAAPFRARWWNYYERGRALNDSGAWDAAAEDLRHALSDNASDQRWARTYGLHTVREYFPNREYGIALLKQGDTAAAIRSLRRSLAQTWSARAAQYLAEAERYRVSLGNLDQSPPEVHITRPAGAARVGAYDIVVEGLVTDDTYVIAASCAGEPQDVPVVTPALPFSFRVALVPGPNEIEVEARDISGRVSKARITVEADLAGPIVVMDSVEAGYMTGTLYDAAGIASLMVDGVAAALAPVSETRAAFRISAAGSVHIDARDQLGNATRGLLPLATAMAALPVRVASAAPPEALWMAAADAGAPRAVAPGGDATLSVRFANLREGQEYWLEEVVATMDIRTGAAPLRVVELNGTGVAFVPDAPRQLLSRKVPLTPGENTLVLRVTDAAGGEAEARLAVTRMTGPLDRPAGRLKVALVGNATSPEAAGIEPGEEAFVEGALLRALDLRGRFALVSRDILPRILDEQELNSILGDQRERLKLGQVVPAEVFLVGRYRRGGDALELAIDGISTETGLYVGHAEVAGAAADRAATENLVELLALRLVQEFPQARGEIAAVQRQGEVVTNVGAPQRIRESTKMVVYHEGEALLDPLTQEPLGAAVDLRGDALVTAVEEVRSTAVMEPEAWTAVEVGDHVATK